MLKNTTYQEKFVLLTPWIPRILDVVKKDLKNEHLKKDFRFCKQYLGGKNPNKLSLEDLVEAYSQALRNDEHAESLGEFISQRWLLKNGQLYHHFETKLAAIDPNFTELETIDVAVARQIIEEATASYGAILTYLFSVINSVVFPEEIYKELNNQALAEQNQEEVQQKCVSEQMSVEAMKRSYEQQIARLTDKYEKKLTGLQKKYLQDTEMLKKQLSLLQRRVSQQ